MELSNDNLLIITDLPACQMHPAQLIGSVVLALCAPVFCFVVRPQQSERTTAVAKTKWGKGFMDSCCHSAERLHRRHPPWDRHRHRHTSELLASGTQVSKRSVEWRSTSSRHVSVTQRGRKTVPA